MPDSRSKSQHLRQTKGAALAPQLNALVQVLGRAIAHRWRRDHARTEDRALSQQKRNRAKGTR